MKRPVVSTSSQTWPLVSKFRLVAAELENPIAVLPRIVVVSPGDSRRGLGRRGSGRRARFAIGRWSQDYVSPWLKPRAWVFTIVSTIRSMPMVSSSPSTW